MGTSTILCKCPNCGNEEGFDLVIEWMGKRQAIEEIEKTKCPDCGSENWYMTDTMGQY